MIPKLGVEQTPLVFNVSFGSIRGNTGKEKRDRGERMP
jgi:hypothetical protein